MAEKRAHLYRSAIALFGAVVLIAGILVLSATGQFQFAVTIAGFGLTYIFIGMLREDGRREK